MASKNGKSIIELEVKSLGKDRMPYTHGVFEVGSGTLVREHPTERDAETHMNALVGETAEKSMAYAVGWEATTFEEAEANMRAAEEGRQLSEITYTFKTLIDNIMYDDEVDKPVALKGLVDEYVGRLQGTDGDLELYKELTKAEDGEAYPAVDYAYVPDPSDPSSWKLRLTDSPGEVTVKQLGRAAAKLSPAGYMGRVVDIPSGELPKVKRRISKEYVQLGVEDRKVPKTVKASGGFFDVWKENSGTFRWVAVYSNDKEDEDNPPETIVSKSHEAFTLLANSGVVDMPELWHWHVPFSKYGVADHLDFYGGFALATGTIDEGMEHVAEGVMKSETALKVSHGMPKKYIMRDPEDESRIVFHVSKEISTLPADRAANPGTGFLMLKAKEQGNMNDITKEVAESMAEMGYTDAELDAIASRLGVLRKDKDEDELHTKEEGEAEAATPEDTQEGDADAEGETTPEPANGVTVPLEITVLVEQAAKDISDSVASFKDGLATVMKEATEATSELKALRDLQVATLKAQTPTESMASLKAMSPIGSEAAKLDGRSSLAKDTPTETEAKGVTQSFGIPFLDNAIAGMQASNNGAQEGR